MKHFLVNLLIGQAISFGVASILTMLVYASQTLDKNPIQGGIMLSFIFGLLVTGMIYVHEDDENNGK